MGLRDLKIKNQIVIGFSIMFVFVILLGVVSYSQSKSIHDQTDELYNHPLRTTRTLANLKVDILSMQLSSRDAILANTEVDEIEAAEQFDIAENEALYNFDVIRDTYLGPKKDIDEAFQLFALFKSDIEHNKELFLTGKVFDAKENLHANGLVGKATDKLIAKIDAIDKFAIDKGDALYYNSNALLKSLNLILFVIVFFILLISAYIIKLLVGNIQRPIQLLSDASKSFLNGDMSARSNINSKNEFGELSDTFNKMVANIQISSDLNSKTSHLSKIMLVEGKPKQFFEDVLPSLASHTNSQVAAVYLLSNDKRRYEHFESFGLGDEAHTSFEVDNMEGEFGHVIASKKVYRVKRIPKDTRFLFNTVSGSIVPREIITVPILSGTEIIAIISLASIRTYDEDSVLFIDNVLYTLSARIESVLAFQKMQEFLKKLEFQNVELEAQKIEMMAQSRELHEKNIELEAQKEQLNDANRHKTSFLSNMSHELRTPLNSVIALSGVLSRRLTNKIPSDEFSYLEVIERNGKHLLSLINDILDISRIESGREEVAVNSFTAKDIIEDVILMIQPQAMQKNIELLYESDSESIVINSDIDKCKHILQNLIANAVKFTDNGKVELKAHKNGDYLEIEVIDTGIGIADENIEHIFEEFRQADGGTSRRYGGTGLGLAIARKYAQLLGGNVSVKSVFDVGSCFTLSLPLNYSDELSVVNALNKFVPNHATATVTASPFEQLKTILLVEDSEPAIIQIKDIMEESGYKVLVARGGNEALEIISRVVPDAMILDLMMPEVDGFQVLKSIRNTYKTAHVPVLVLTAKHITTDDLKFLKQHNVSELIQKGDVNRVDLLKSVGTLLSTHNENEDVIAFPAITKSKKKPVVLVVEDNPDNMLTVKAVLGSNYVVYEAWNGNEGVEMAKKHHPDLILMDIALPQLDGIEAFKMIRENSALAQIPIIAITASALDSEREIILAHGFDAYLPKPIDEKQFFSTIKAILYGL